MPAPVICHKFFQSSLSGFNQARVKLLMHCSDALIKGNRLTLTDIGRNLSGKAKLKHKIKRVDRFLNNQKLHEDIVDIYGAIAQHFFQSLPYIVIAVDWSGYCGADYHLLRASLVVGGRSIPIHNMIVELKDYETAISNTRFLNELAAILNTDKKVYIISDGGYLTPWFTQVLKHGWHFVGRIRGTVKSSVDGESWQTVKELHPERQIPPTHIGGAQIGQHSKSSCEAQLYLYKEKPKGRKGKSKFATDNKMYRRMADEPWLISIV
jgi:Transposase DDE domain